MKKQILLSAFIIFAAMSLKAQTNVIQGGNMEDDTKWTVVELGGGNGHEETFNFTDDIPANGQGGCLRMTTAGNWATVAVCQQVTIQKGIEYKLSMLVKNQIDMVNTYFEITVMDTIPANDAAILAFPIRMAINTWNCSGITSVNGNLADFNCDVKAPLSDIVFIEGQGDTTIAVVIKAGSEFQTDFLIDDVALISQGSTGVKNVVKDNGMEAFMSSNELRVSNVKGKVAVFNVTGQVVKHANVNGQFTFNVSDLPSGIYFIQSGKESRKVFK